jgi:hypothetical protein
MQAEVRILQKVVASSSLRSLKGWRERKRRADRDWVVTHKQPEGWKHACAVLEYSIMRMKTEQRKNIQGFYNAHWNTYKNENRMATEIRDGWLILVWHWCFLLGILLS